jgi:hypothetical protein
MVLYLLSGTERQVELYRLFRDLAPFEVKRVTGFNDVQGVHPKDRKAVVIGNFWEGRHSSELYNYLESFGFEITSDSVLPPKDHPV